MKDASGEIHIDLPIRGNLDDPEFAVGKVVLGSFVNLVTKAATSPFALVGGLDVLVEGALPALEANGVPIVGGIPAGLAEQRNPISFAFSGGTAGGMAAFMQHALEQGQPLRDARSACSAGRGLELHAQHAADAEEGVEEGQRPGFSTCRLDGLRRGEQRELGFLKIVLFSNVNK